MKNIPAYFKKDTHRVYKKEAFPEMILERTGEEEMKKEWLLNLILRSVLGVIAIYFINAALAERGISLGVGINIYTVLTSGILGFPGLAALYGIGLYKFL